MLPLPRRGNICCMLPPLRRLEPEEWHLLRLARLTALNDSPDAFLATHAQGLTYSRECWEAELRRGDWYLAKVGEKPLGMVGVTPGRGMPRDERYLEYVWVAPCHRGHGDGERMLTEVLDKQKKLGRRTVSLWVADGNETALWLYKRLNFQRTNERQTFKEDPARIWVRLRLDLAEHPASANLTQQLDPRAFAISPSLG